MKDCYPSFDLMYIYVAFGVFFIEQKKKKLKGGRHSLLYLYSPNSFFNLWTVLTLIPSVPAIIFIG